MSLSPAIIDAMVASGCTVEQMAAVMKAALAGEEQRLTDKRAKDAERQRRHRASRDVTVTPCDSTDSVTDPALSHPPNENNSNPPTHTHPDITTRPRKAEFPKPDWADAAVWGDFLKNRKAKRLPNTATAHAKLLRDLDAMTTDDWPPGRLLEAIVARGWAAAYDPRENENGRQLRPTNGFASPVRGSRPNPALDMVLQAEREQQAEAERESSWPDWSPGIALPSC